MTVPRRTRVLMVCLGNICRSPTAEATLRRRLEEAGLADRVEVDSAGTAGYHVGSPPDRRAIVHGERRGLALGDLRGRQVAIEDFERFDHILAMDDDNLAALARLRPANARARVALLMSHAPATGAREVPDPYDGGPEHFEKVLDLVDAACAGLVAALSAELKAGKVAPEASKTGR